MKSNGSKKVTYIPVKKYIFLFAVLFVERRQLGQGPVQGGVGGTETLLKDSQALPEIRLGFFVLIQRQV